jgi:hypothetical protein
VVQFLGIAVCYCMLEQITLERFPRIFHQTMSRVNSSL